MKIYEVFLLTKDIAAYFVKIFILPYFKEKKSIVYGKQHCNGQ